MNFSKNIIIYSFLIFVPILLMIFFCILPLARAIEKNKDEISLLRGNYYSFDSREQAFLKSKELYKSFEADKERVFVNREMPINIIELWEETASQYGIELKISAGLAQKGEGWDYTDFQISAKGQYSGFMKFLEKIERASYITQISNLFVEKDSKSEEQGIVSGFTIKVFHQ